MIKGEVNKFTDNKIDYPFRAYVSPNYLTKDGESLNIVDKLDSISEKIEDYIDKVNDYNITEIYIKNVRLQKEDGTLEKLNNYDLYVSTDYNNKIWDFEYTPGEYYYGYGVKCKPSKLIVDVKIKNAVDEFEELNAEMSCWGNETCPDYTHDKHNWQLKFKSEYRFGEVPKTDEIRLFADADDSNHLRSKFGGRAWENLLQADSEIDIIKDNNYDTLPETFKNNKIHGYYKADIVKVYINESTTEYVENADYQGLYSLLNQKNEKMYGFDVEEGAAIETYWPFTFSTNGTSLDTALSNYKTIRTDMQNKTVDCYMGYRYGNIEKYRPRGWDLRGPWTSMNDMPLGTYETEGFRWQAGEQTDEKIQSFNDMIEVINDTSVSGYDWVRLLNEKLDIKSVIDYYLFNYVYCQTIANFRNIYFWNDNCSSNKWHIGGGNTYYIWDNSNNGIINGANREIYPDTWFYGNGEVILFERLWNETNLISDRYKELRNNGSFTADKLNELFTDVNCNMWYAISLTDSVNSMFDGKHTVTDPNGVGADITLTNRTGQLKVTIDNIYNVVNGDNTVKFNQHLTKYDALFENGTMTHKHWLLSKITPVDSEIRIDPENPVINLFDYFEIEPKQFISTENEYFGCSWGGNFFPYGTNVNYGIGPNGANCGNNFIGLYGPTWIEKNEDETEYKYMLDTTRFNVSAMGNSTPASTQSLRMTNWEHKYYPNTELTGTNLNNAHNNLALCEAPWNYSFSPTDTSPAGRVKNVEICKFILDNEIPTMIKDVEIKKSTNKFEIIGYTNAPKFYGDVKAKIEVNGVDVTDEFKNYKNEYVIPERFTSDTEFKITPIIKEKKYNIEDVDYNIGYDLPEGYTKLSYIENNASNWINTEITLLANDKVETRIDYNFIIANTSNYALFGARASDRKNEYSLYIKNGASNGASYHRKEIKYFANVSNGKQIIRTDNTGAKFYDFDENLLGQIDLTLPTEDCTRQCYLFAYNNNNAAGTGGQSSGGTLVSMYYFKVFDENDTLKAYLIPAIEQSTNRIGMYDVINNKFLANRATSVFDYAVIDTQNNVYFEGTPVYETMKYIPNIGEPLRCIGTGWGAYVDTGIKPSQLVNGYIDCTAERDKDANAVNYDAWIYGVGTTRNDDYTVAYGYGLNFRRNTQTISVRGAFASTAGAAFNYAAHNDDKFNPVRTQYYCNKECILTNKQNGFTTRAYRNFICTPEQMEAQNKRTMYLYAFNGNDFNGRPVLTYIYDFFAKDSNDNVLVDLTPVLKDGIPQFYDMNSGNYYPIKTEKMSVNGQITYKTYDSDETVVYDTRLLIPDEDSEIIDLDYIGTNMNAPRNRIDTGINVYDISKIKAKFKYSARVNYSVICGSRSKASFDIFELSVDSAGKVSLYENRYRGQNRNKIIGNTALNMNQMYEVVADYDDYKLEVIDNTMTYGSSNQKFYITKYSKNNTLWLFNDNSSLDNSFYNVNSNVSIAYIEITTKDGVEHKLYPKLYNGIPVFYDLDTKEKHAIQSDYDTNITKWFYSVNGTEHNYRP